MTSGVLLHDVADQVTARRVAEASGGNGVRFHLSDVVEQYSGRNQVYIGAASSCRRSRDRCNFNYVLQETAKLGVVAGN